MKMVSWFINHVFRSLGAYGNNHLTASLFDSTKTVFFTELFDGDLIRGSLRELFTFSREEPPVKLG